jgi:hypothetical protein
MRHSGDRVVFQQRGAGLPRGAWWSPRVLPSLPAALVGAPVVQSRVLYPALFATGMVFCAFLWTTRFAPLGPGTAVVSAAVLAGVVVGYARFYAARTVRRRERRRGCGGSARAAGAPHGRQRRMRSG